MNSSVAVGAGPSLNKLDQIQIDSSTSSTSMVKQAVPTPTVKRKAPAKDTPPSERARPSKKVKPNHVADSASISSTTSRSKRPAPKNAEAGPSTQKEPPSSVSSMRISSRVSKPTMKKVAAAAQTTKKKAPPPRVLIEEPDSDSDGLPLGILPSSSKKQTPSISPNKLDATPKRKVMHLGAIELSSGSEDNARARPPRKRVKTSSKPTAPSEVIDLCSDDGAQPKKATPAKRGPQNSTPASNSTKKAAPPNEVLTVKKATPKTFTPKKNSPRKEDIASNVAPIPKDEVFVILSTDDEAESSTIPKQSLSAIDKDTSSILQAASPVIYDTGDDTFKAPTDQEFPSLDNDSPPFVDSYEPAAPTSSSPPMASVSPSKADSTGSEDVSLDSLQASYKKAMEGREFGSTSSNRTQRHNSAFTSAEFSPPTRVIMFSDVSSTPTLHTPIYFSRSMSSISTSPTSSKRHARTALTANSPAVVDVDPSESVEEGVAQSNPVSNSQTPSSSANEGSVFLPAQSIAMDQAINEFLPSPSTVSADPLPEDLAAPLEMNESPTATIEYVNSSILTSDEPMSCDLPSQSSFRTDEEDALPTKPPVKNREETIAEEPPASYPASRLSTYILPSNEKSPLHNESESCDATIPAASHDDAYLSPKPPSRDGNALLKVDTPAVVNPTILQTSTLRYKTLSVNEEIIASREPVPRQDGDLLPSIPKVIQESIRLVNALQDIAAKKAGQASTKSSEGSLAVIENMSRPVEMMSSAPAPSTEETVSFTIFGQDSPTDVPPSTEPHPPTVEVNKPLPTGDLQPSIIPDSNENLIADADQSIELTLAVLESASSSSEDPRDVISPPILLEPHQDLTEENSSVDLSSPVLETGPSVSDDQQGLVVDTDDVPIGGNSLSIEDPSTILENKASLYKERQAPILLDSSQSPAVENNILDDSLPLILTDLESESSLSNAKILTPCVSVEKEASLSVDPSRQGGADCPDDAILLTVLDNTAATSTVTLPTPDMSSQTRHSSAGAPLLPSTPLEQPPLPNADLHGLTYTSHESVITPILGAQDRHLSAAEDTPSGLSPSATGQELLPLEEPEAPIHVEPIQIGNGPAGETPCSASEKETSPSELQDTSCQPTGSPILKPLDDPSEHCAIPLPPSTNSIAEVENSPLQSLSSSCESLSPATPVQQRKTEPLIWTEPPRPPPVGLPILDIDMSQISISWLMSSSKSDEPEDDDDISGLELMYPEELY